MILPFLLGTIRAADGPTLVANGSFAELDLRNGAPAHWSAAGANTVRQTLTADAAHAGRRMGRDWQRQKFTFAPREPFLFIAVGLDLEESKRDKPLPDPIPLKIRLPMSRRVHGPDQQVPCGARI